MQLNKKLHTDVMDVDGYSVQAYTVRVAPPIYPDNNKNKAENTMLMMQKKLVAVLGFFMVEEKIC